MPLRSYRPTSPGLRQMTRSTFDEITTDQPHKPLTERSCSKAGRNSQGKLTVRHQGGGHKRAVPHHRLEARQVRRAGRDRDGRVRPEPLGAHRPAPLRRRREALHAPAARPGSRRRRRLRRRMPRRASATRCRWRRMPLGTQVHNVELVAGRGGQIVRSAGSSAQLLAKEGEYGAPPPAVRRGAPRARRLHGDGRPGRATWTTRTRTSARPAAAATWAAGPRCAAGDEPARPPARRWRGQVADRHAAEDAVGQAGHGPAHPQEQDDRTR